MAQHLKIQSIGSIGSIILATVEVKINGDERYPSARVGLPCGPLIPGSLLIVDLLELQLLTIWLTVREL